MTDPSPSQDPTLRAQQPRRPSLVREFTGIYSPETITQVVVESAERLAEGARILTFLPLLAHRFARERLRALARAEARS